MNIFIKLKNLRSMYNIHIPRTKYNFLKHTKERTRKEKRKLVKTFVHVHHCIRFF